MPKPKTKRVVTCNSCAQTYILPESRAHDPVVCPHCGCLTYHVARKESLAVELDHERKESHELAEMLNKAIFALDFLGLPSLEDPNFDALVTHAAYKLGLLVYKR